MTRCGTGATRTGQATGATTSDSCGSDTPRYPLGERGHWFKDSSPWTPVRVENGTVYSTNGVTNTCDDSAPFLTGNWGPNQSIGAVVQVNS